MHDSGMPCPVCARFGWGGALLQIGSGQQGRRYRCSSCGTRLTIDKATSEAAVMLHMSRPVTPAEGVLADGA